MEKNNYIFHLCHKPVKFDDMHMGHEVSHSLGETIVENGRCSHDKCNLKKGATVKSER